jgi:hypothetical protein
VVTVSSPLAGTPIAASDAFERDLLLYGVHLASVLGTGKLRLPLVVAALAAAFARHAPRSGTFAVLLRLAAGLDDGAVKQVQRFFATLGDDRQLWTGLSVAALASRVAALRDTDHPHIHCYVSVSPPPRSGFPLAFERLAYHLAYEATSRAEVAGVLPRGPVLGGRIFERLRDARPSDGVVPVLSQTLDGTAAAIVEADHLDVVGLFAGGPGATVFKSNAGFDGSRLQALWGHVAEVLLTRPSSRSMAAAV